jgi:hypothetical protein
MAQTIMSASDPNTTSRIAAPIIFSVDPLMTLLGSGWGVAF